MLPIAAIERIVRRAGVERISADALKELEKVIEEMGIQLARESALVAKHAGRRTILGKDVKLASGKA